jgi:hypothetical protein
MNACFALNFLEDLNHVNTPLSLVLCMQYDKTGAVSIERLRKTIAVGCARTVRRPKQLFSSNWRRLK